MPLWRDTMSGTETSELIDSTHVSSVTYSNQPTLTLYTRVYNTLVFITAQCNGNKTTLMTTDPTKIIQGANNWNKCISKTHICNMGGGRRGSAVKTRCNTLNHLPSDADFINQNLSDVCEWQTFYTEMNFYTELFKGSISVTHCIPLSTPCPKKKVPLIFLL